MPKAMYNLIGQYIEEIKKIYGSHVRQIILYGSYARGDFRPDSDIDIMILVDIKEEEIHHFENAIYDSAFDSEMKYGKSLSPVIKNAKQFEYWSDTLPFYRNIVKEGIKVA